MNLNNNQPSFANIAGGPYRKAPALSKQDFPSLNPTREEILMSNLLNPPKQPQKNLTSNGNQSDIPNENSNQLSLLQSMSQRPNLDTDIQQNSATNSLDRFGLGGIIDLLRLSDPDKIMLSSGCDLPSLGLDLSSTDPIHPYFLTPYSDSPVSNTIEPAFKLSSAYNTYKVPNVLKNLKNLTDDTLFYIFYSMPRDILQEAAAQELYKRKWKYHKEFKLWLQSEETEVSLDCEKGLFVFFDPASWTRVKKDWVLYFDQLEERVDLVSEDTK